MVFATGLLLAGLAPGMELFVAARFLQGLGAGAMTVSLYVVVARIYAPVDHPAIFGAFAAAWVIPSMVGPSLAGVVAETVGWRWVFLGVVALAAAATAAVLPAVRGIEDTPERSARGHRRPAAARRRRSRCRWSPSTSPGATRARSGTSAPGSRCCSCWSPYARWCRPAPCSCAAVCRR